MKVSVIIKALNEERNIARAIESSLRAVAPFGGEVVLADSGSGDRTVEIASRYPIRIVQLADASERCCGIAPQLGYQHSRGEYVYVLDGDMELDAQFLKDAIALLDRERDVAGVGGFIAEMRALNLQFQRRMKRVLEQRATAPKEARCLSGGGLYRRSAIESVGYLSDRNLKAYEEYDLGVRLRGNGWRLVHLPTRAADHYSYALGTVQLLWLKLRGGAFLSQGQIVRAAFNGRYLPQAFREIFALRLAAVVSSFWLLVVAALVVLPYPLLVLAAALVANAALVALVGIRHRSLKSGLFSVVNWNLGVMVGALGIFKARRSPTDRIASRILKDAVPAEERPAKTDARSPLSDGFQPAIPELP
jgi:glycosyltransferase involved in cell wall biosynthesis